MKLVVYASTLSLLFPFLSLTATDWLDQIDPETVPELSRENIRKWREDWAKNDPIRRINLECELEYYATVRSALIELQTGVMTPERMEENKQKLGRYMAICVLPHIPEYQMAQRSEKDIDLRNLWIKRIARLTSIETEIKKVLKQPLDKVADTVAN